MKNSIKINRLAQFMGIIALSFLTFSGCDSSSKPKVVEPIHSCEILTVSEVEKILGSPVEQPPSETHNEQEDLNHWMSSCSYSAPESNISAGLLIRPLPNNKQEPEAAYDAYTKQYKESWPDVDIHPVEGIANKAFWAESLGQLTIFSNSYMYIVSARAKDRTDQEKRDLVEQLATAVLAKTH